MNVVRWFLVVGLSVFAAVSVGRAWVGRDAVHAGDGAPARWRCPMHPQIEQDRPGGCPICGMDLVVVARPVASDAARENDHVCPMHPEIKQAGPGRCPKCKMALEAKAAPAHGERPPGRAPLTLRDGVPLARPVALVTATERMLSTASRARLRLELDEAGLARVHPHVGGYLERLVVGRVGVRVHRGQVIATVFAPELLTAQGEFLVALRSARTLGQPAVADGARTRLAAAGLSAQAIARLEATGEAQRTFDVLSPATGVVLARDAAAGQRVDPGTTLLTIGDLGHLFAVIEVPETALASVSPGHDVELTLDAHAEAPPRTARVLDVLPRMDPRAGTVSVRARVENDDARRPLLPGMSGTARWSAEPRRAVMVPAEAVVDQGRGAHVFRVDREGRLEPVAVRIGLRDGAQVEVTEGLAPGARVATGAVFLLDAQSALDGGGTQP
jgi:Cu(I)/Ag(I) efflux system membrane fusion protein